MEYVVNTLLGNEQITQCLADDVLDRYINCKIVFSYAKEDWPFVEQVARALRIYFPQENAFTVFNGSEDRYLPNVFCYTKGGKPFDWVARGNKESPDSYAQRNDKAADACYTQILADANVFVLFTYKHLIKAGSVDEPGSGKWQGYELMRWLHTNSTQKKRHQFLVDFQMACDGLNRLSPKWESVNIPLEKDFGGKNMDPPIPISVTAYDQSAALKVAEQILRKILFNQSPDNPPPASTVFSYEKNIVKMYREIPEIVSLVQGNSRLQDRKQTVLKMLAYIQQSIPAFWPCIARQSDFQQICSNPLVDAIGGTTEIGAPRIGLDMLWPEDKQQSRVGSNRNPDMVVAAALSKYHGKRGCRTCMLDQDLAFPEAGPRKSIYAIPPQNVAIVVSGGIAPGINAVIDGIVRRQKKYSANTVVKGIHNGFYELAEWNGLSQDLTAEDTSDLVTQGGSCLRTCRLTSLLPQEEEENNAKRLETIEQIVNNLCKHRIKILYIIGGDGTMRAAHHLDQICRQNGYNISIIGIPKTMDNDVLWVWQSFGFSTAVEKARETIEHLATEVSANPRICVLQLFGSASGFVVSHAVLASRAGTCDFALIPEAKFTIEKLAWKMAIKIATARGRLMPYGLVVMAESAIPTEDDCKLYRNIVNLTDKENDALDEFLKFRMTHPDQFPDGQVSNELRSAGLRLVSEGLRHRIVEIFTADNLRNQLFQEVHGQLNGHPLPEIPVNDEERFRVFTNEPRHLLRSVPPSFSDVIMGNRLGALAVDNAMAGYTGFMISQWLTEFVMVPLDLVALGRKHIPQDGIFWKSVLAKTGQGNLT